MSGPDRADPFGLHRIWPKTSDPASASQDSNVDIVAIHGLDTYSPRTWQAFAEEGDSNSRLVHWLQDKDMLPDKIPGCRIYTYNWNSATSNEASQEHVDSLVLSLVDRLGGREEAEKRVLIFVASCFGGLLLAKALNFASSPHNECRNILESTIGIVFLGTPFRDSNAMALKGAQVRALVAGYFGAETSSALIDELEPGHKMGFVEIFTRLLTYPSHRIPTTCFYETRKTDISKAIPNLPEIIRSALRTKTLVMLVEEESACLGSVSRLPLATNHAMLNKYRGPKDDNFNTVARTLLKFFKGWEKQVAEPRVGHGIMGNGFFTTNKQSIDNSTKTWKNCHYIVNPRITPTFTGRKEDLAYLERVLSPTAVSSERSDECRIFVMTGASGVGKSELCLKLASRLRERFWGVFWVDAPYPTYAFFGIAKAVTRRDWKDLNEAYDAMSTFLKPWLLILDDMKNPEMDCTAFFHSWSLATILITSQNRKCEKHNTIGSMHLQGLEETSAVDLFYKSAEITGSEKEDAEPLVQSIVNRLQGNPVGILHASAQIRTQFSTLSEYCDAIDRPIGDGAKSPDESDEDAFHSLDETEEELPFADISRAKIQENVFGVLQLSFEHSVQKLERSDQLHHQDALDLLGILSMADITPMPMKRLRTAGRTHSQWAQRSTKGIEEVDIEPFSLTNWHHEQLPPFMKAGDGEFDDLRLNEAAKWLVNLAFIRIVRNSSNSRRLSIYSAVQGWFKQRQNYKKRQLNWVRFATMTALSCEKLRNEFTSPFTPHFRALLEGQKTVKFQDFASLHIPRLLFTCYKASSSYTLENALTRNLLRSIFSGMNLDPETPSMKYVLLYMEEAACQSADTRRILLERIVGMNFPEESPTKLEAQHRLATAYLSNNDVRSAITLLEDVVRVRINTFGQNSAEYRASAKKLEEAYKTLRSTTGSNESSQVPIPKDDTLGESNPEQIASLFRRAMKLVEEDPNGAMQMLDRVETLDLKNEQGHRRVVPPPQLTFQRARVYLGTNNPQKAIELLKELLHLETMDQSNDPNSATQDLRVQLARGYLMQRNWDNCIDLCRIVLNGNGEKGLRHHQSTWYAEHLLSDAYRATGRYLDSMEYRKRAVENMKLYGRNEKTLLIWSILLADMYADNGQLNEAIEVQKDLIKLQEKRLRETDTRLLELQETLARFYLRNGQEEEGAVLKAHIRRMEAL